MTSQQSYDVVESGSSQEQTFRVSDGIQVSHLPTLPSLVLGSKRERERNTAGLVLLGFSSLQLNDGTFLQTESRPSGSKRMTARCVAVAGTGPQCL